MFRIFLEREVGICHGATLLSDARLGLLRNAGAVANLSAFDLNFDGLWMHAITPRFGGLIPSDAHDRLLVFTSQNYDRNDQTPYPTRIFDYDDKGALVGERECPFLSIAQISQLSNATGYVISGTRWNFTPQWHWEPCAAVLPTGSRQVQMLPGKAAASLPCGKLVYSSEKKVTVATVGAENSFTSTHFYPHLASDSFHWLFEIDGGLWGASDAGLHYVGGITDRPKGLPEAYSWPDAPPGKCVCCPPYVIAVARMLCPPFVLDVRTGHVQTLANDGERKVKEVFSIDAISERGRTLLLTLHRSVETPHATLRLWAEE